MVINGWHYSCLIIRMNVVLNRTVVDSDWCFDNLNGSHLYSKIELYRVSWWYLTLLIDLIGKLSCEGSHKVTLTQTTLQLWQIIDGSKHTNDITRLHSQKHYGLDDNNIDLKLRLKTGCKLVAILLPSHRNCMTYFSPTEAKIIILHEITLKLFTQKSHLVSMLKWCLQKIYRNLAQLVLGMILLRTVCMPAYKVAKWRNNQSINQSIFI